MSPTPVLPHSRDVQPGDGSPTSSPAAGMSTMVDSLADIGTHLRSARLARGLSLREMARRIGVSPSFVSQVELGKAKPSLGTLYGFLSELDLSLDELMPATGLIHAARSAPLLSTGTAGPISAPAGELAWISPEHTAQEWQDHPLVQMKGVTWRRLTADDPLVDFLHVTYEPGAESCPTDHLMRHEGHEYGHVVSGTLTVQVAFETFELRAGDAINFPSTTPHRLYNDGPEPCTSIWVVVGRRSSSRVPREDSVAGTLHPH